MAEEVTAKIAEGRGEIFRTFHAPLLRFGFRRSQFCSSNLEAVICSLPTIEVK